VCNPVVKCPAGMAVISGAPATSCYVVVLASLTHLPYFEKINIFFNIKTKKFELIYKD
jgi:hypothetical protein